VEIKLLWLFGIERMNMMNDPILERIQREAGIPDLIDVLVNRLNPTDLKSLLLEVYRRRALVVKPSQLLEQYERDRFVRPSDLAPEATTNFERLVWSLLPDHYTAIELSPVCPLGTNTVVATVDQNNILTAIRNTEVVADTTNVLALECASRRRILLRLDPHNKERVRLCTSQRVVRGQLYREVSGVFAHFRLLGLCSAGRDEGSFQFETTSLVEQISFYIRLLREASQLGYQAHQLRITLTDLDKGRREETLVSQVLTPLMANNPDVIFELDPNRETGRGYYVNACFHIYASNMAGSEFELIDGGFTTWTQQLLSNNKERLLISGLGTERFCSQFSTTPARAN
jgi:hypothetical protein